MNNFATFQDWLQKTENNGVFLQSPSETLTWAELKDFSSFKLENQHSLWSIISSDSAKTVILSLLKTFHLNKTAIILDPRIDHDKKQNILRLLDLHLQQQCPQTVFLLSSGSSGELKLIGVSFAAIIESAKSSLEFYKDLRLTHWGLDLPLHHVGGLMVLWRMLLAAGRVTQDKCENLIKLAPDLEAISLVPTQLLKCLNSQDLLACLPKLKLILLGGAACSDELYQKIQTYQLPVSLSYGSTETCSQIFATPPGELTQTVGKALDGVELITPASSQKVERVSLKAKQLFHALINQKGLELLAEDRLYQTTDLGELTPTGELIIKGRADQIFISGGENISPEEIENQLKSCPGVEEVLLVPRSDPRFGQVGHLFYREGPPNLRADLQDFIKDRLLAHERPKSLSILPQSLMGALKPLRAKGLEMVRAWEKGPQTPLLFFHGFMGHPYDFDHLFEELIHGGIAPWRLKSLSLPGHGHDNIDNIKDFESYLDRIIDKYQHYFEKDFILYGYSLGARICFQLMLRQTFQQKCLHLFCEGGNFGLNDPEEKRQRQQHDANLFSAQATHEEFEKFLRSWHNQDLFQGLSQSPFFSSHLKRKIAAHQIPTLYKVLQLTSTSKQNTTQDDLNQLAAKPSYFTGEFDKKYTQYSNQLSQKGLVDSYSIANASHNIHLMNPRLLAQKMIEILDT